MKKYLNRFINYIQGFLKEPEIVADNMEGNNKNEQDIADTINGIVRNHSNHARKMGRYTAFSILGLAWTVSYQYLQFNPTGELKVTFFFAILYLLIDYFYHIFITLANKRVLRKCYVTVQGKGYQLKTDKKGNKVDPTLYSRKYSTVGTVQILVNAVFLLISAFFLIKHILLVEI